MYFLHVALVFVGFVAGWLCPPRKSPPKSDESRGDLLGAQISPSPSLAKEGKRKVLEIPPPPKYWDHYPTQRSFEAGEDREFWEGNSK